MPRKIPGAQSPVDAGRRLARRVDDTGYLAELEATLVPFLDEHRPDLVLYQAGVDPFVEDRLGRLALTQAGLVARETLIADLALTRSLPLASTVGGGYGDDVMAIAERHVTAILTLGEKLSHRNPRGRSVAAG